MKFHKETHASTTLTLYNFAHHYGLSLMCLPLFLLLLPATAQFSNTVAPPPPSIPDPFSKLKFDRNMAIIIVILVVVFFILGFLSVYTRQCTERRSRGRLELTLPIGVSGRRARGLNSEIIDTFPTFVYSTVKGRSTLECAVCLNEFEDDETLRLIPKCSHVFHPDCIGMWLASHSTCPLCRANLIPRPGEVSITIPTSGADSQEADPGWECEQVGEGNGEEVNRNRVGEECGNENVMRQSERRRAGNGILGRSHSTGHSLEGENWERFTLRLPEEVVKRTNSCVTFRRERTYRTRSAGERWGFTMRPSRSASNVGERSSDPLCPGNKD